MTTGLVFGYKKADGGTQLFRGTAPDPPDPTGAPRIRLTGLGGRTKGQTDSEKAWITAGPSGGFTVLEVKWSVLQPAAGALSATKVAALHADFDWAESLGLPVFLRVFCGSDAPDWAKTRSGGAMTYYTNDATTGGAWVEIPGGVPRWWAPAYADAYEDLMARMAAEFGDEPNLAAVSMSLPMTEYAEPCIHQFEHDPNRAVAKAAGLTTAKELTAFTRGWAIHATNWSPHDVATACSFNTHQGLSSSGGKDYSMARTTALMDEMRAKIGDKLTIWENNSLMAGETEMTTMYEKMKAAHTASGITIHIQTRTLNKHIKGKTIKGLDTSPYKSVLRSIGYGAQSVEMPSGGFKKGVSGSTTLWPEITLAQAADLNARLVANIEVI